MQKNLAPKSYGWYLGFLQSFIEVIPKGLRLRELKPWHVQQWADADSSHSQSSRRAKIITVQRAIRWAEQQMVEMFASDHGQVYDLGYGSVRMDALAGGLRDMTPRMEEHPRD